MGYPVVSIVAKLSVGELLDKITILELKSARFTDARKLANVRYELSELMGIAARLTSDAAVRAAFDGLRRVNTRLWDVENEIRMCESRGDFGERFVQLARAVYRYNDERAALKRRLNELTGSEVVEEKSYAGG